MRVYEIAKQKDMTSKEVIALLKKIGLKPKNHLSLVSDEDLKKLEKLLPKKDVKKDSSVKKTAIKKAAPEKLQKKEKKIQPKKPVEEKLQPLQPTKKEGAAPKKFPVARPKRPSVKVEKKEFRRDRIPEPPKKIDAIKITKDLPLFEAADMMSKQVGELVLALLKTGVACNKNRILSKKTISSLAHQFGIKATVEEVVPPEKTKERKSAEYGESRWPIVVVMGHVDHGKTTLLDYIRKMNTAKQEKGGITQKLSAYEVVTNHGKVSFLDTPGHEAFSYMRKKGASITDIVVLVVAVDDGVMPQTVEVIKHAKSVGVPLIAAINKIDKIEESVLVGEIEKVKRQLAQYDLLPEDWGGNLICVPVSAETGKGIDELLEMIVLQSQIMELKADPEKPASCFVLESKKDKGLGLVATLICASGTIRVGDYFSCGTDFGKVRLLINSLGQRISSAGPSTPVQVIGFDGKGVLGECLNVISAEEYLRTRSRGARDLIARGQPAAGMSDEKEKSLSIIIKADSFGSKEAVLGEIKKLNKKFEKHNISINVVQESIGDISAKDVELALQIDAKLILCLHCGTEKNAATLAREKSLEIKRFDIIYKAIEFLEEFLKSNIEAKIILKKTGAAMVRKVFDSKSRGIIAGCYVTAGTLSRGNIVVCMRNGEEVGRGKIVSLQREKKDIKEIHSGFECGFIADSFQGWQIGDEVHGFKEEKQMPSF